MFILQTCPFLLVYSIIFISHLGISSTTSAVMVIPTLLLEAGLLNGSKILETGVLNHTATMLYAMKRKCVSKIMHSSLVLFVPAHGLTAN